MNQSEIDQLRVPGRESCSAVSRILGTGAAVGLTWGAQRAPGFLSPAAPDGRLHASLTGGWSRLSVPSEYDDIEGDGYYTIANNGQWRVPLPEFGEPVVRRGLALPDQWEQERNFHHAWYGLRVNLERPANKAVWLRFDAVTNACVAFVNGVEVGRHWGGYTPFEFDVTAAVQAGDNTIQLWVQDDTAVRDNGKRRMTGMLDCRKGAIHAHFAGIRGGVYLDLREPVHLVRSRIRSSTRRGVLRVESWLRGGVESSVTVRRTVYEWPSGAAPVLELPEVEVASGGGDISAAAFAEVSWPDAARAYCRKVFEFLKREFNFISTRLHKCVYPAEVIQAADEAGVLAINQSGLHSGYQQMFRNGGEELMDNLEREITEWYWRDVNSPALVIWDMENELIRSQREPDWLAQVLTLDDIIRRLDPDSIIQHSGAGWYHPQQQVIHVHMHEHYSRIMSEWRETGKVPLNMGEFWMGGNGETRLPNGYEYSDREDWHREEARLYREKMLEMRNYGVSGIMPHRLTHWPLLKAGELSGRADLIKLADSPYRCRGSG